MKFDHVYLIGLGGTGSHLVGPLVKLLWHHPNGTGSVMLIDGDKYERSNRNRQVFEETDLGENKAEASAGRVVGILGAATTVNEFVDKEKFTRILEGEKGSSVEKDEVLLVITAVDNHATRKDIILALDEGGYQNFVLISPGNTYDSGQVILYVKWNGERKTVHPFDKYSDLADPEDTIPQQGDGCMDQTPSTPQLITANMGAAWSVLCEVSNLLDDKTWHEEVHYNCRKGKLVARHEQQALY